MRGDELESNHASVRLELQADYLAGVWAHHAQRDYQILEEGDIAEALNAANQIGDDTLQKMSQGVVIPERFTHGSSAQRVRWFKQGLASGDFNSCKQLFDLEYTEL
jgi:predicted metalloprotease